MSMHPSNTPVGKIETVPVREAFRHEALDFTQWLEKNIEALSERLGFELTVLERETTVGDFHVDLLCEDQNGNRVIIENQLERTDHGHLGQVLTYLVNLDAQTAIWIATESRLEHQRVIDWLNENTAENISFYLVRIEAIRIGNSPYAPLFTVLAQPDEQTKQTGALKQELAGRELAERHHLRLAFWERLLEKSKGHTKLGANRSPTKDHWLSISTGIGGVNANYLILKDHAAIDLYIDVGDQAKNKAIFDTLFAQRELIESEFGHVLDWRRLDDKRASRVHFAISGGNLRQPETWDSVQTAMIEAMIRFDKALRPRLMAARNL